MIRFGNMLQFFVLKLLHCIWNILHFVLDICVKLYQL